MKSNLFYLILFLLPLSLFGNSFNTSINSHNACVNGKLKKTILVDGFTREYIIHVPVIYDHSIQVPLVFMLHGTGGSGDDFYENHGWKELSEKENFIVVYPSALRYRIFTDGENKTITKWNTSPDAEWVFQAGETGADDIKFLRRIIEEMKQDYKIDAKRIYLNGFSNGGAMASKCAVEMSDVLAAVAENAASFYIDTVYIPKRKLPVLFQVGNKDYGPGNIGPEIPLIYLDTLLSQAGIPIQNGKHFRIANNHIRNFNLQSSYTIVGDTNQVVVATYLPKNPGPGTGYEFKFILVKALAHAYPNGENHFFDAPKVHWNWMQKFMVENTVATKDEKNEALELVSFYPNPSQNKIQFDTMTEWNIMNLNGESIKKGFGNEIDISNLPPAIYFLKMENKLRKLIKN